MHTIPFILGAIASGLGSALALPLPRPDLLPTTSPNVQTLSKRDPTPAGNSCSYDISPAYQWEVYIHNESQYEQNPHHDNCGGGFLDNFRGRCGVITTWTCTYVNPDGSPTADQSTSAGQKGIAYMNFFTSAFCQQGDIGDAISAGSFGQLTVGCGMGAILMLVRSPGRNCQLVEVARNKDRSTFGRQGLR